MHGGLSPDLQSLEQIKKISRPTDVPETGELLIFASFLPPSLYMLMLVPQFALGLLCDLLWADPDKEITGWGENDRGVSFTFGSDVVARFLVRHDLVRPFGLFVSLLDYLEC